jgi:ATP-binding cassette subfamily B protein
MLGMIIAQSQRAAASAERVSEVLAEHAEVREPAHPRHLPRSDSGGHEGHGKVRFDSVTFAYGPGPPVVEDLTFEVAPGEAVAIVGATGSGKTTIARLLPRFYDVGSGAVTIDDVDVRSIPLTELRRAVGLVFEDTFLFADTIAANITFAAPDAPIERVEWAARLAGADEFVEELPDGYRTLVGERGFSLSGGQRQRLAIARALLADPRVLILDDATSAVDPTKEHEIRGALTEVMRGRTTIVIAHRPATIALADRVLVLDGGRVVAEGTHEQLLREHAVYQRILAAAERHEADDREADDREVAPR